MSYIDDFLRRKKYEQNASSHTIEAYGRDLADFSSFLEGENILQADSAQIFDYLITLKEKDFNESSIQRRLSCLRSFYKDLIRMGLRQDSPMDRIDSPKSSRTLPKYISEKEIETLCSLLLDEESFSSLRNLLIVELLYSCGLRVSELCNLAINDIFLKEDFLKVLGKGNKERLLPVGKRLKETLKLYLPLRKEYLEGWKNTDRLVVSKFRKGITRMGVWKILNIHSKNAGITKIHPHMLRHSFASHMLARGADLRMIQELLGHEDLSTTEIYTHVEKEHLAQTLLHFHPLAKR